MLLLLEADEIASLVKLEVWVSNDVNMILGSLTNSAREWLVEIMMAICTDHPLFDVAVVKALFQKELSVGCLRTTLAGSFECCDVASAMRLLAQHNPAALEIEKWDSLNVSAVS
jgi:hypothetical protein